MAKEHAEKNGGKKLKKKKKKKMKITSINAGDAMSMVKCGFTMGANEEGRFMIASGEGEGERERSEQAS